MPIICKQIKWLIRPSLLLIAYFFAICDPVTTSAGGTYHDHPSFPALLTTIAYLQELPGGQNHILHLSRIKADLRVQGIEPRNLRIRELAGRLRHASQDDYLTFIPQAGLYQPDADSLLELNQNWALRYRVKYRNEVRSALLSRGISLQQIHDLEPRWNYGSQRNHLTSSTASVAMLILHLLEQQDRYQRAAFSSMVQELLYFYKKVFQSSFAENNNPVFRYGAQMIFAHEQTLIQMDAACLFYRFRYGLQTQDFNNLLHQLMAADLWEFTEFWLAPHPLPPELQRLWTEYEGPAGLNSGYSDQAAAGYLPFLLIRSLRDYVAADTCRQEI